MNSNIDAPAYSTDNDGFRVPYDPPRDIPLRDVRGDHSRGLRPRHHRSSEIRSESSRPATRASRMRRMLGVDSTGDDCDDDDGGRRPPPKRRRVTPASVAGATDDDADPPEEEAPLVVGSRPPPSADVRAIQAHARAEADTSGEEVSEIACPLPAEQWRADDEYIPDGSRDPRFFRPGDASRDFMTERRGEYCFACTMTGEFATGYAATLREIWSSAILSFPTMRAAAVVSEYYDNNMRMDADGQRPWTVTSVRAHYTSHEIDATTQLAVSFRDHVAIGDHQFNLINRTGPNGNPIRPDPAAIAMWMRTKANIVTLSQELKSRS